MYLVYRQRVLSIIIDIKTLTILGLALDEESKEIIKIKL